MALRGHGVEVGAQALINDNGFSDTLLRHVGKVEVRHSGPRHVSPCRTNAFYLNYVELLSAAATASEVLIGSGRRAMAHS